MLMIIIIIQPSKRGLQDINFHPSSSPGLDVHVYKDLVKQPPEEVEGDRHPPRHCDLDNAGAGEQISIAFLHSSLHSR
jgi:hypothetical protein